MIWKIEKIDQAFVDAWQFAGEPDQEAINRFLARKNRPQQKTQNHTDVKRWYYLMKDDPRVRLATLSMPLQAWLNQSAKMLVGTNEIIGEFEGNKPYIGKRGLRFSMQPCEWLQQTEDQTFLLGSSIFDEISEQILNKRRIEKLQDEISRKYRWS